MKAYVGTKIVQAEPMRFHEFQMRHRGLKEGMSAGALDSDGYKVMYDDGYVSWSPKDVFERCYREITVAEVRVIASAEID